MNKMTIQSFARAQQNNIFHLVFCIVTSLGVFFGGLWAGVAIGGGLLVALARGLSGEGWAWPPRQILIVVALFLAAVWLSCLHAVDPDVAIHGALKMTTVLIPLSLLFLPLSEEALITIRRKTLLYLLLAAICMAILSGFIIYLTVMDLFSPYITKFNRGFSYMAILIWPLWAFLLAGPKALPERGSQRYFILVSLCVFLFAAFANHSKTSALGIFFAMATFCFTYWKPRLACGFVLGATLFFLALPWWIGDVFPLIHAPSDGGLSSAWHRLEIWDYLHYYLVQDLSFLHGWGIANTSFLPVAGPHAAPYRYAIDPAAHPHNAAMQIWGETGLPGVLAFLYMIYIALNGILSLPERARPFAWAAYVMSLILIMSAYNFWTDSLWAALALTAVCFGLLTKERAGN
ncbi:MAG: O-antigen ligase domain-containing protein [Proteobacteria bacterium]|jgi:O-antigen ligase|nr:O-antigen ligase family protein [Alphaproteobacteria bacterium]NCC03986.1 O-antigen ligase domain-containing protein [Pseudomonadota bacterium]